jgi:hypothetical protein
VGSAVGTGWAKTGPARLRADPGADFIERAAMLSPSGAARQSRKQKGREFNGSSRRQRLVVHRIPSAQIKHCHDFVLNSRPRSFAIFCQAVETLAAPFAPALQA